MTNQQRAGTITTAFESEEVAFSSGKFVPTMIVPTGVAVTVAGVIQGQLTGARVPVTGIATDVNDDGDDQVYPVIAGVIHPYSFKVIRETGTTATGIVLVTGVGGGVPVPEVGV